MARNMVNILFYFIYNMEIFLGLCSVVGGGE